MSAARTFLDEDGSALVQTARFDELTRDEATELLRACCANRRWVSEVVAGRPYGSLRQVIAASDDVLTDLSWHDVVATLDALAPGVRAAEPEAGRARLRELVRLRLVTTLR